MKRLLILIFLVSCLMLARSAASPLYAAVTEAEEPMEEAGEEGEAEEEFEVEFVPPVEGTLRWGGDSEGGFPYMFPNPQNHEELIGFEVDIVDEIAKFLGKEPVYINNAWDNLIPGLSRNLYDISINGLEVTPEHEEAVDFSIPYYRTFLQLAVRTETEGIETLGDLKGKVVGTLKESYAQMVLEEVGDLDIRTYIVEANTYEDLANGRLDAALFDAPIALYSAGFNPKIKFVGEPIGEITYAIALPKGQRELLADINRAIVHLRDNGKLREIYDTAWEQTRRMSDASARGRLGSLSSLLKQLKQPLVVIVGGSLGARHLTNLARELKLPATLVVLAGPQAEEERVKDTIFLRNLGTGQGLPELLRLADVVVARAGATTLSELAILGKPVIIVPKDVLPGGHQTNNAARLAAAGAAIAIPEDEIDARLEAVILELLRDPERRRRLTRQLRSHSVLDADERLADLIEQVAEQKPNRARRA